MDDNFKKSLAAIVDSYRLPAHICNELKLDNHSQVIRWPRLRDLIHRYNSNLLAWLSDLNRVNLLEAPPSADRSNQLPLNKKLKLILFDRSRTSQKKWPWFLLATYAIILIFIGIYLYIEYVHDANLAKFNKLKEHLADIKQRNRLINELKLDVAELSNQFEQKINATRDFFDLVGRPFIEWSIVVESHAILLLQTVNWFVIFSIENQLSDWTLLSVRGLIDRADETRTRFKMTLMQLHRFELDSKVYSGIQLNRLRRDLAGSLGDKLKAKDHYSTRQLQVIMNKALQLKQRRLNFRHELLMNQLKLIGLEGRLNPLNRTPASRDKLILLSLINTCSWCFYSHLLIGTLYYGFHSYYVKHDKPPQFGRLRDIWVAFVYVLVVELTCISSAFLSTIFVVTVFDQLEANKRIQALIFAVINANELRVRPMVRDDSFHSNGSSERRNSRTLRVKLNGQHLARAVESDLIMVVIQCRLNARAYVMAKEPVQQVASFIASFAIFASFIFLLHGAYMEPGLRTVILCGCLSVSFFCIIYLAPLGLLYRRRVRTIHTIWNLVGQLVYFETVPKINKHLELDSSVSLYILRGFLDDSRATLERMSIKVLWLTATYENLVRIFTYILVFIMAGGFLTLRLFGDGLASIMSDPFRLYSFLKIE